MFFPVHYGNALFDFLTWTFNVLQNTGFGGDKEYSDYDDSEIY